MSVNETKNTKQPLEEQIFDAIQAYEALKQPLFPEEKHQEDNQSSANHGSQLLFNDIVQCINFPALPSSVSTLALVNTRLDYRRLYGKALSYMSDYHSPKQIAASSDTLIFQRQEARFLINIEQAEHNDDEILVRLAVRQMHQAGVSLQDISTAYLHVEHADKFELVTLKRIDVPGDGDNGIVDPNSSEVEDMDMYSAPLILSTMLDKTCDAAKGLMEPNAHISFTF